MKEYKIVEASRKDAEHVMNEMAKQGWEVVSTAVCEGWTRRLLITFCREIYL